MSESAPPIPAEQADAAADLFYRSLKASLWVAALFSLYLLGALGWDWTRAFLFFVLWSVANLYLLSKLLLGIAAKAPGKTLAWLVLLKLGNLAILLLFFSRMAPRISAFVSGFHLPFAVLLLKAIGWQLTRRRDDA